MTATAAATHAPHAQAPAPWATSAGFAQNNFDALRFFFAGLVIFAHSFALLSGTDDTEPLMMLTHQMTFGGVAVDCFFIISGCLVTLSWQRSRGVRDYLSKRVRRIYPGFIVAMAFCALVIAPIGHDDWRTPLAPGTLLRIAGKILVLDGDNYPDVFAHNPFHGTLNGSIWSIRYEAWCYVGVIVMAALGFLNRRRWSLVALLGATALRLIFEVTNIHPGAGIVADVFGAPYIWARLLPCYLAGVVFLLYRDVLPHSGRLAAAAAVALVVGGVVPHGLAIAFPLAGSYLLFWVAFSPRLRLHGWARRGDFSYGLYLYAFPIQQALVQTLPGLVPMVLFPLSAALTLVAAVLSWHGVEKRFLARARKPAAA